MATSASAATESSLGLALQGGGAHGAFTWGVLDRLLEQPDISFEAISGTSSGALNALALAQGWMDGGRDGARACLAALWERIAAHTHAARWIFDSAPPGGRAALLNLHRYFTPRQMNPLGYNPVRQIAEMLFDFERLREAAPFPLHLAATRVRDGALVMFGPERLSIDALLASTCLPQLFAPVTIDGEVYWDGGWAGNPVLEPLVYQGRAENILCVLVQPLNRSSIPDSATEIAERMNELGFSTTFLRELRTLTIAQDSLDGALTLSWLGRRIKRLHVHLIEPGESLDALHAKTRFDTPIGFLSELRDHGRTCAGNWIARPDEHVVTAGSLSLHAAIP
jgi:NTE family protein